MSYLLVSEQQCTGEICPECGQEVILLAAETGAGLVECDCGSAGILSAA